MNLSELTKEQKQYIALGGIVVGVVIIGIVMGVKFSLSRMEDAKVELADLNMKIDRAEKTLSKSVKTRDDFEQSVHQLEEHLTHVTPGQNYYSWATEIVYSKGRKAGLEIESVDEVGMSAPGRDFPEGPAYLETYSLRITARGGFSETKEFLRDIEENHPLVRFSGLEIGKGMMPEVHEIQLFVQWPFKMDRIAALWEGQTMRNKPMVAETKSASEPKAAIKQKSPVVAAVEPVRKLDAAPVVKQPEPVVAAVKPVPAPKRQPTPPVEPAPVVKKPEPVVAVVKPAPAPKLQPTPPVEPVPEVKKPEPVVAVVKPAPAPKLQPTPPVEPVPEVKKPEPVVAVVKPAPAPKRQPTPPVDAVPEVKQPEPVVTVAKPEPSPEVVKKDNQLESLLASIDKVEEQSDAPVKDPESMMEDDNLIAQMATADQAATSPDPEAVEKDDHMEALLASIDMVDGKSSESVSDSEPMTEDENIKALLATADNADGNSDAEAVEPEVKVESEMSILLASLDSHGSETPDSVQKSTSEHDDLAAYVQQLAENKIPDPEPEVTKAQVIDPAVASEDDGTIRYVTSSKSANILVELLTKNQPKASASLGSFLDGLVEDINDKH